MHYLKELMLSKPYFERRPAPELIADNQYSRYDYVAATKGNNYAFAYTYTGRNFSIDVTKLGFQIKDTRWLNPASGKRTNATFTKGSSLITFDPPGAPANGNDWVLILEGDARQ